MKSKVIALVPVLVAAAATTAAAATQVVASGCCPLSVCLFICRSALADQTGYVEREIMADPEIGDEARMPRWVKVFGLIALALVALFLVVHLAGGGMHGDH